MNNRDGLRTVDFVLEGIMDFAFSVWTVGYLIVKVNAQYLTVVNECVDRQGKTMDTRHKLPAIMCVLTYLNRGQNVLITINYIQTTHSSNFVYNVHHEQHNIMGGRLC